MIAKIKKAREDPRIILLYVLGFKIFRIVPDRLFLKILYKIRTGQKLYLDNPQSFNEKLQWLKLYDRKPKYTVMVDKYEVRKYIKKTIGAEYLIPLLGVYSSYDDIDFAALPNKFVLKPSHTSGNIIFCKDKSEINYQALRSTVSTWINREYYWLHREWPYKDVKPRVICEEYMVDKSETALKDYRFYCFNGKPKLIQVNSEKQNENYYINHFDLKWCEIDLPRTKRKVNPITPAKPDKLEKMIEISRILSRNIPFLRVDLYETEKGVYFGETTFFPMAGFIDFADPEDDYSLGSWVELPRKDLH